MPDDLNAKLDLEERMDDWPPYARLIFHEVIKIGARCDPCVVRVSDHEIRLANEERATKKLQETMKKMVNPRPSKRNTLATGGIAGAVALGILTAGEWILKAWLK